MRIRLYRTWTMIYITEFQDAAIASDGMINMTFILKYQPRFYITIDIVESRDKIPIMWLQKEVDITAT